VFPKNKVKKYRKALCENGFYFLFNYLYTHGDGESEKKKVVDLISVMIIMIKLIYCAYNIWYPDNVMLTNSYFALLSFLT
jgi:hypothetical protein